MDNYDAIYMQESKMPEFDRRVLEVLREPLESGRVTISRAARHSDFPARFQLIAAMNPCPCGFFGHSANKCRCTTEAVQRYQNRISGPFLDRIDMQIEVSAMAPATLSAMADGESTATIAERVVIAHAAQLARQATSNARLSSREVDCHCLPDKEGERLLDRAMTHFDWSARAYHRVLKLARTIADLAASESISAAHVAEAIQYRRALRES
jgi:magnesium chelatase family protein